MSGRPQPFRPPSSSSPSSSSPSSSPPSSRPPSPPPPQPSSQPKRPRRRRRSGSTTSRVSNPLPDESRNGRYGRDGRSDRDDNDSGSTDRRTGRRSSSSIGGDRAERSIARQRSSSRPPLPLTPRDTRVRGGQESSLEAMTPLDRARLRVRERRQLETLIDDGAADLLGLERRSPAAAVVVGGQGRSSDRGGKATTAETLDLPDSRQLPLSRRRSSASRRSADPAEARQRSASPPRRASAPNNGNGGSDGGGGGAHSDSADQERQSLSARRPDRSAGDIPASTDSLARAVSASAGSLLAGTYQRRRRKDSSADVRASIASIDSELERRRSKSRRRSSTRRRKSRDAENTVESGEERKSRRGPTDRASDDEQDGAAGGKRSRGEKDERKRRKSRKSRRKRRRSREIKGERDNSSSSNDRSDDTMDEDFETVAREAERDLLSSYVGLGKWEPVYKQILEAATANLFSPTSYVLPQTDSLLALLQSAHSPEEDGLYVGDPPKVNPKNLRKVEKRLRASEPNHGESWFGPSQHLALLPNPLRYRSYRPNAPPPVPIPAALVGQAQNSGSDLAFPSRSSLVSPRSSTASLRDSVVDRWMVRDSVVGLVAGTEDDAAGGDDGGRLWGGRVDGAVVRRKATVATRFREIPGGAGARDGLGDGRGEYTLVFCLAGLDVEEHPLLCEEIKLAREVERWISALRARRSADVTGFLTKKLTALKASYDEYLKRSSRLLAALTAAAANRDGRPKNSDGSPVSGYFQQTAAAREAAWREKARDEHEEKRLSYMNEIRATRLQRDAESQATLLLEFKILEAWNKIKQLRRTSGCTSSPLKVLVRPFPSHLSAEEERLEFDRDLRDELLELEELHEFEMEIEHRRYKETVAKWKEAREAQRNEANSAAVAAKGADGGAGRKQTTSSPSKKAEDEDGKGSLWLKSASEEALRVEAEVEKEAIKRAKREEELREKRKKPDLTVKTKSTKATTAEKPPASPSIWSRLRERSKSPRRAAAEGLNISIPEPPVATRPSVTKPSIPAEGNTPPIRSRPSSRKPSQSFAGQQLALADSAIVSSPPPPYPGSPRSLSRSREGPASPLRAAAASASSRSPIAASLSPLSASAERGRRRQWESAAGASPQEWRRLSVERMAGPRVGEELLPRPLSASSPSADPGESQGGGDGGDSDVSYQRAGSAPRRRRSRSTRGTRGSEDAGAVDATTTAVDTDDGSVTTAEAALLSERTELRRKRLLRARSPRRKSAGEARVRDMLTPRALKKLSRELGSTDSLPDPPEFRSFNAEAAAREIARRLESSRKRIGAPILAISYSFSEPVTEMIKCSKDEHRRRLQVDATSVFLRIYYNDKEVTRTVPRPIDPERFSVSVKGVQNLGEDYSINVDEATRGRAEEATVFAVKVTEIPESIRINVYETGVLGEDFLGEVFVALPEPTETTRNQDRPFSNISFVGRPFRKSPSVLGTTTTDEALTGSWVSGHLKINVAWGVDEEGRSLGPPLRHVCPPLNRIEKIDPLATTSAPGVLNLRKLMEWVADIQIDAKDPRNAELLRIKELMRMGTDGGNGVQFYERWSQRKFFRVNMPKKLLEVAVGVGTDISDTSKRIELLKKRARNEVVVHGPVPLVDSEIHAALYDKVADPVKDDAVAMSIWSPASRSAMPNPKTDTSLVATSFLKRVRMHQLIQSARQHRPPRVEDFVREERLAEAQPQQNILFTLFQTRRPLKPNRTSRLSRVTSQPDDGCNIVVQVQKGFNIPVRSKDSKIEDVLTPRNLTGEVEPSVRCYVEVSFQRRKVRTSITDGPNPTWNESLTLPLRPPGDDFRPENLLDSTVGMEQIFFNVFDEYLVDLVEDERERDIEIHQRRERNWLGGFSIPFTSLYEQTRIEGSFHVMIPPVLLGYEKNPTAGPLENSILIGIDPAGESLLNLFITLEPPLVQPAPLHLKFISDETERFLRYASKWTHALTARHPHRPVLATTLDLTGHTTFICRYIRPQQPPQHLTTPRQLQRYVSSIPFLADRTAFAADVSLWATSEQVLELGAGDSTEHAILLCNYLKAARPAFAGGGPGGSSGTPTSGAAGAGVGGSGVDAYVVLGWGIPEGRTAYVLVRNKVGYGEVQVTLMNAVTGESYRARDPHLPLKVVGCVFNEENIWANVQRHDDPARVSWNIHDAACWRPFFSSRFPRFDYTSVQCDLLTYRDVSARRCKELEGSIEKTLVAKIESWRGHRLTRWNRLASKCLKPLVSRLEADHLSLHTIPTAATAAAAAAATSSVGSPVSPTSVLLRDHHQAYKAALAQLKGTYRLCGFPLHATYTDVDAVVEMVHATDVHANADPSVEFALAVWCGGYPGGFVSVWVYVASLTRGKGGL